jgi:hypothetical protein
MNQSGSEKNTQPSLNSIYETLSKTDVVNPSTRQLLRKFLQSQISVGNEDKSLQQNCAYTIAGLMSTRAVSGLPSDDLLNSVFELAGQLELPLSHQAKGYSWKTLAELIEKL